MKIEQLNTASLRKLKPVIDKPKYALTSVSCGVVHFGTGNFHRAHQAVYCDTLLNKGETNWGITGISLRSPVMRDNLAPQNYLYTLAILGETTSYRVIGAIQNLLVGPEDPQSVIDVVAHGGTQLVTTTITEKGYYLTSGGIDRAHPDMLGDLASISVPKTIYGYLAAALIKRSDNQGDPLTILCCDNMHGGGEHLQQGVQMLLERHSPDTLRWVEKNVAFSSSMVDRVTPATDQYLKDQVAAQLGVYDAAPVAAEPFTQWIIEDRFAGIRPPFEQAGALFVNDIAPFERIKLRFLNAGHSILAALGYLAGDQFIHEALQRPCLAQFAEQALKLNVMPVTPVPEGISSEAYINQVLQRFKNGNLPYGVLQVGTDSSQKIQQRILPTIDDGLSHGGDTSYLAFALGAWVCFIRKALQNDDLNDPLADEFSHCISANKGGSVAAFLTLAGANKFHFFKDVPFMAAVQIYHSNISEMGVEQAIDTFFNP
ncbi:mannitol dehydrogenase family protein [Paraglaciecola polaris]|uniref:Mannitol 2-dehydrogenase n=1 Tax=Paraglaciecola polaris LMG 21857 TaxID=1129793 RepID=K6ZYA3_9ALTE|nr:mannitol dehydrogenase family protein [Paraglaciecola polaris]GAC35207.1 mannitol 2-dehydrogenase [Paraglaciecola polaris LMG 21857]